MCLTAVEVKKQGERGGFRFSKDELVRRLCVCACVRVSFCLHTLSCFCFVPLNSSHECVNMGREKSGTKTARMRRECVEGVCVSGKYVHICEMDDRGHSR